MRKLCYVLASCLLIATATLAAEVQAPAPVAALLPRAESGDAEAQYLLGRLYYYDEQGVPRDYRLSFRWFRLAALQGHAAAEYKLGGMYFSGRGVARDDNQTVHWWRLAALQGHAEALNNLGAMIANGRGAPQDRQFAYALQALSLAKGNELAAENLKAKAAIMNANEIAAAEQLARELQSPDKLAEALDAGRFPPQ